MTQPDPESQTPPARVLLPLGTALSVLPALCMAVGDVGPVANIMMIVLIVMGAGIVWQGIKNLRRDKV